MLPGPLVFVDIDTQHDFLDPRGALFVPGSEAIVGNLRTLTRYAQAHDIPVLATACAHQADDDEFARFPPHCLAGTPGQERIDATRWAEAGARVITPSGTYSGILPAHLTLEKRELDAFSHPEADLIVALYRHNRVNPTFVVYGVATEYCVKAAVLGLLDRRCRVAVVVDAIRAIDPADEPEVLAEFTRRGSLLTITEAVCSEEVG